MKTGTPAHLFVPDHTITMIFEEAQTERLRPVELIKKSFTGCGLNNAPDGSDDGKMSCFKNVTDMSGGIERLKQKRQENSVENLIDDINISEDEEDAQSDISIDIQN
uniref:Uncharacterized protein n=2 Tax=Caenorhabditis japonica TaxID=281687 RepID=A0A8R1IBM0_CAEJA